MSENKPESPLKRKLLPMDDARQVTGATKGAFRRLITGVRSEREESFEQARLRLGWSENDIQEFIAYRKKESTIYLGLTLIAFLFACGAPYSSSPLAHLVTSLAVMVMVGARLLVANFRLTQLRCRALYSFREYLRILIGLDQAGNAPADDEKEPVFEAGQGDSAKVVELNKEK